MEYQQIQAWVILVLLCAGLLSFIFLNQISEWITEKTFQKEDELERLVLEGSQAFTIICRSIEKCENYLQLTSTIQSSIDNFYHKYGSYPYIKGNIYHINNLIKNKKRQLRKLQYN